MTGSSVPKSREALPYPPRPENGTYSKSLISIVSDAAINIKAFINGATLRGDAGVYPIHLIVYIDAIGDSAFMPVFHHKVTVEKTKGLFI